VAVVREMTLVHMDLGIFHRSEGESIVGSIKNTSSPVRLTKNQKKLEETGEEKIVSW